jgi:hypothetical protein
MKAVNGYIYRIDCFMAGDEDHPNFLDYSWMINEMQLVRVTRSFISSYHNNGPQAKQLADGLVNYITKFHHPYYPA